ncbi:AbrB family transcriptional regulator [Pseudomonas putida]|uniref:AbrB family transcriptional regulator n=1 Tax=Pseudomonas putida TaxID=303 RepID=UPI001074F8E5|nr:AbrB family transcriptional regulator [Pseudomonas putida]TFW39727.1 AbrB family transcriptional regulator [Pseudomonas putida]
MLASLKTWWATPLVGIVGALLASAAHWPLPWIIGSMLAVIFVRCSGWLIAEIPNGRKSGQWMIATSIGLHFTQPVVQEIANHFPMMLAAAFLTLLLALIGIAVMRRQGMDLTTAYFAFMPANFAEMIQLGMRYRADVSQVAAAHSIRLVLIVLSVPPAMFLLMQLSPGAVQPRPPAEWQWLGPMLLGGAAVALLWKRLGLPNPWVFGPMALCAVLTASFDLRTALPVELSQYGQLMIGCALGSFFDRGFFRRSPLFLLKVVVFTLTMIVSTFLFAWGFGGLTGMPVLSLALGMMPGSSTEMYLTAEALHLGAGMVTAMQIMRLIVVMLCAEPLLKLWLARQERTVASRQQDNSD